MKRVALASIFSLFLGTQLNAQEIKKQERPLDKFTTISLSNEDQVILKQSNQTQLTISYANGNPNDITSEVKTGVLSFKKRKGNDLKGVKLLIESPQFKNIILSGASDVKSDSVIKTDSLWITVSGAGDLRLNINANYIESTISGAGDVELSGKTDIHRTTVSGAGDLRAINLVTKTTHATITRSGDAKVNATDKLTANITGAGGIFYKNEPLEKDIDVSAAGTARKLNGNAPTKDSTKIKLGDTQIIVVPREESKVYTDTLMRKSKTSTYHHWSGLDVGVNFLHYNGSSFQTPAGWTFLEPNYGKSFNWKLNFVEKDFNLYQEKVNLVTGLGLEWANYGLLNQYTLKANTPVITAISNTQSFKKNRLQNIWINVPALLEFNTSNITKKSAHVALGVVGGYRLSTNYKQKYFISDKKYKSKVKDDFNMNDYKLAATARVGFGKFTMWAEYNITPMLKNNQGPLIYPLTVGITIVPFD